MKNLYEVLNINKNSSEKEIKDRYMTLVRKYPPEKEPQKFAEIREAYEILCNPKQRQEHDFELEIELKKRREILKKIEEEADKALKNGNYDKAIKNYKKLLIENSNPNNIKTKLGIALLKNNNLKEAEKIFKELIKINDNFENNYNLYKVYYLLKYYNEAEKYLLKANEKSSRKDVLLELIDLEIYLKNYEKVERLIHEFLNKYDTNIKIINYSLVLIINYIKEENESKIYRLLNKNINKLGKLKLEQGLIRELINLVYKLYYINMIDSAKILSDKLVSLGCTELEGIIYEKTNRDYSIKAELFDFIDDKKVINMLKMPIIFNFVKYEDNIFTKNKKENIKKIKEYINAEPELIINSIKIIKVKYSNLYSKVKKIYDNIEILANKNLEYISKNLIENNIDKIIIDNKSNPEKVMNNKVDKNIDSIDKNGANLVNKLKKFINRNRR